MQARDLRRGRVEVAQVDASVVVKADLGDPALPGPGLGPEPDGALETALVPDPQGRDPEFGMEAEACQGDAGFPELHVEPPIFRTIGALSRKGKRSFRRTVTPFVISGLRAS